MIKKKKQTYLTKFQTDETNNKRSGSGNSRYNFTSNQFALKYKQRQIKNFQN